MTAAAYGELVKKHVGSEDHRKKQFEEFVTEQFHKSSAAKQCKTPRQYYRYIKNQSKCTLIMFCFVLKKMYINIDMPSFLIIISDNYFDTESFGVTAVVVVVKLVIQSG